MAEPTLAELFSIVQRLGETVQKGVDIQLAMSNELATLKGTRAELFSLVSFVLWAVVRNSQLDRAGLQEDLRQLSMATSANGEDFLAAALRSLAQTASGEAPSAPAQ
ncbi:MAG TPA: hypothetical protein VFE23_00330 [Usitatibacter sp.]|jgi:hypothetical protein|nr:hypothetical protein [Usitatibacter sp.]